MISRVVNIKVDKFDMYIGRGSKAMDGYFGNPFKLNDESERAEVVARYKRWFWDRVNSDITFRERVMALKGKRLGCFCSPRMCHGDVIVAWLNAGCPLR